jgi:hypothetical protein
MENNKVYNGVIYVSEMEAWVDVKEYLQHAMSLINDRDPQFELSYRQCCDENDNWFEPYIRVSTKHTADEVLQLLADGDIDAQINMLEQDDGDEYPGGPPIMMRRYSVELIDIKLDKKIEL